MRKIGVITGDIVDSTKIPLEMRPQLSKNLLLITSKIESFYKVQTKFYRGDSVQMIVDDPIDTLAVSFLMRSGVMSITPRREKPLWDIRVSASVGDWELDDLDFAMSDGEAFRLSGRGLDNMKKNRIVFSSPWDSVNAEMAVCTAFFDVLASRWTKSQAQTVFEHILNPGSRSRLADTLDKSMQSVSRTLNTAGYVPIDLSIARFEQVISKMIHDD